MKLHNLWSIDPGYFHLKRATKTILGILITLWLVHNEDLLTKMMACLATGFSMQGIIAKAFSSRIKQVITLDIVYFLVFNLGLLVRGSAVLTALTLIFLGFFANYMRRFGLQNSVAPMMGWTLCFFATTLPFSSAQDAWLHMDSLVLALSVSAIMILIVLPENYPRLFVSNTNRLFDLMAKGMHELRRQTVWMDIGTSINRPSLEKISKQLTQLLESNQVIEQSGVFVERAYQVSELLVHQYALVHIYRMMMDAYLILARHDYQLSSVVRLKLNRVYKQFESLFMTLNITEDKNILSVNSKYSVSLKNKPLCEAPLNEPVMILVILNLKLSFILLEQHIALMLRGANED